MECFEAPGVNFFVFSDECNRIFFDEKIAGIEIIHYVVRTSKSGVIRLQNTPEQWYLAPNVVNKKIEKEKNTIEVELCFEEFDFNSRVNVIAKDEGLSLVLRVKLINIIAKIHMECH